MNMEGLIDYSCHVSAVAGRIRHMLRRLPRGGFFGEAADLRHGRPAGRRLVRQGAAVPSLRSHGGLGACENLGAAGDFHTKPPPC